MNEYKTIIENLYWTTSDGLKIHAKDWHIDSPKAVILIVHGLGEHCERYAHLAAFFNKNGFGFMGYDRRGHGLSEGKRGHTVHYEAYLEEVEQLLDDANKRYPKIPIFIYGHSMGGNIALNYVIKKKPEIAGLLVSGALIDLAEKPSFILVSFAKLINKFFPNFTLDNGLDPNNISTVKEEVEKYINDPLVHGKITSNTGIVMMNAASFLHDFEGQIPIPTLMMHGGEDKIVAPSGSRDFSKRVKGDFVYKEWHGLFHEIHNENKNLEIFNYELDWINKVLEN